MRTIMRLSLCLAVIALFVYTGAMADPRSGEARVGECLRMTVAADDIASFGGQVRQHYRIFFENLCDSVRVVYWCAEHPSKSLTMNSVCAQRTSAQAGIVAPLYAVIRQREFQWTFPPGTRIRFVDCADSTYPTSDFRCAPTSPRPR